MSDGETMVSRLTGPAADALGAGGEHVDVSGASGLEFLIEIRAADSTPLLRMFERGGRLAVECDPDRLEEGAKLFVAEMMRWSGLVGIRWKGEAAKAAGEQ